MTSLGRPWRPVFAVLLACGLIAASCSSASDDGDTAGDSTTTSAAFDDAESTTTTTIAEPADTTTSTAPERLVDTVAWEPCGQLECGIVEVPADYEDPSQGTIEIAINVFRAQDPDQRIGVLMVNPGGPGVGGLFLAEAFAFGGFPQEITDHFDVVGFDPRGVGQSEPSFACGASGEQLAVLSGVEDLYDTEEEIALGEQAVQLCVESMGLLAGRIHTDYVVRDMDEIRKAIGENQISYLGYSYGSLIGSWYASVFPDNVRAMVVDGADNPLDEDETFEARLESTREEIQPIEDLLGDALLACVDVSCPIFNGGDPLGYYFDAMEKSPLINSANADNASAAFLSVITPLYQEAQWSTLWDALADLEERDDPALFSELLEFQLGPDPGEVNLTAHINCLDNWVLKPEKDRETRLAEDAEFFAITDQLDEEFPLLAAIEGDAAGTCNFYDTIAPPALDVPFDGGGVPILVIGNTSDPVTSFGESEELANETLSNGILLEVDHRDHTVFPSNNCVNEVVVAVLVDGNYPDAGTKCVREEADLTNIVYGVCVQIAPSLEPTLDAGTTEQICDSFVDSAYDRLGPDVISEALEDDDFEAAEQLLEVLQEEIDSRS